MKNKKCKVLSILLLVLFLVSLAGNIYLFHSAGYTHRIALRLGLTPHKDTSRDKHAVQSWQTSLESLNTQADVVFFGDSITRGNNWQKYFPDVSLCNLGYSGDNVHGLIRRAPMVKAVSPKKIFIMIGVNNMGKLKFENTLNEGYRSLISRLREDNPGAKLYIISILPVRKPSELSNQDIVKANALIEKIAQEMDIPYINAHSAFTDEQGNLKQEYTKDGVHLSDAGKDVLAGCVETWVRE